MSWIKVFEPHGSDMIFERNRHSCYASREFAEMMGRSGQPFLMAGFAGETAFLSTAIDAFHRGHNFSFLQVASASHALEHTQAEGAHLTVGDVMRVYRDVIDAQGWITATHPEKIRFVQ